MRKLLFYCSLLLLSSCYTFQIGSKNKTVKLPPRAVYIPDSLVSIELSFIGNAVDYSIFELIVENHTEDELFLSNTHFYMVDDEGVIRDPLSQEVLLSMLSKDQNRMTNQKKETTVGGVIATGLSIGLIAAANGPVEEAIGVALDNTITVLDSRSGIQRVIDNIEEERDYILEMALTDTWVPPRAQVVRDIHFKRLASDAHFDIHYKYHDQHYTFIFD